MSRFRLTIEYDGTNYKGWQSQPHKNTIQDRIEGALFDLFGKKTVLCGSGRTDTGVHAFGQVAHFDMDTDMTARKMVRAINAHLPDDIRVKKAEKVADDFHARFDAKSKTYMYKLYLNDELSPIRRNYYHQVYGKVDIDKMRDACKYFEGTHDFYAFSSKSDKEDTIRTLECVNLTQNGDEIYITLKGDGFLYNMVRVIVATLIDIGKGRIACEDIPRIFDSKDRSMSGKKLTAEGLYLMKVEY